MVYEKRLKMSLRRRRLALLPPIATTVTPASRKSSVSYFACSLSCSTLPPHRLAGTAAGLFCALSTHMRVPSCRIRVLVFLHDRGEGTVPANRDRHN
jgi:hypothetical protein